MMEQTPLPILPILSPTVRALCWAMAVCALVAFPTTLRLWRQFARSFAKSVQQQPTGERTLGEKLGQAIAVGVFSTAWGILLTAAFWHIRPDHALTAAQTVAATAAATFAAFWVQYAGFALVGYTFTSWALARQWLHALTAAQAMSAYFVFVPAICAIIYPEAAVTLAVGCGVIFLLFRICLWVKGFQIFYDGPFSIFHFFLYLCTLETAPLLLPVATALFLS